MQNLDLSIVIPIDLHRRSWDIYKRIRTFVQAFKNSSIQIIFGCNNQPKFWVNRVKKLIKSNSNIHLSLVDAEASSLSKLRNTALRSVKTKYVLFLDIDIYPDLQTIHNIYKHVIQQPNTLGMFPCLYLSKNGSKKIKKYSTSDFIQHYFDFRRDLILHLAFPSSIILTDMTSVQAISGFDEAYIGHGYEDFDFMLRLFKHKNLIEYRADILIDEPYLAPLMSIGLRALLAQPYLEILLSQHYFLHIFHKKDKAEHYYQQREVNKNYFITKFKNEVLINHRMDKLKLLELFFTLLENKKESPKYAVLWAEIEGHKLRKKAY
ncbi:galactosyltransferase-related protein [Acinetobacter terrestris]|uniref:galactosyltransferase-related protein n=1 Tax=Acinetobacter terrestris TaxID=2529843 RepID=UPI0035243459